MNVLGIIAEYNPFHNGHAYQIETLRKETDADYVIIAMSGNFVQRGVPALMEKYSRARMALSCGADLVLELPALYACASAEYFAGGGIALLEGAGVVTHLGFGTEYADFSFLQEIANILCREPEPFQDILQQELKKGLSFPAARARAVKACFSAHLSASGSFPDSPNNILAVEYLKALSRCHSEITPSPLLRRGQSYHDTAPGQVFSSASAIRAEILKTDLTLKYASPAADSESDGFRASDCTKQMRRRLPSALKISMPKAALDIIKEYPHPFLQENDFSPLLHYKLLTESSEQLALYADSSPDLARRMKHESGVFLSWNSYCSRLKSKNFTYTRLNRVFLHTILNIYQTDYQNFPKPACLRVLGFRKKSAPLLSAIKASGNLPLVTNPTQSSPAQRLLSLDLAASDLYRVGLAARGDNRLQDDFKQPVIVL